MRRASEIPHVAGIVQVGIRSLGKAGTAEVEAARPYGSRIVTAREVHAHGIEAGWRHPPDGAAVVTLNRDGLDPGIMSDAAAHTPGGLAWTQEIELIAGASQAPIEVRS